MKVIRDDLWLCVDCLFAAVNGDLPTDSTPEQDAAIKAGLDALGPHLVIGFDSDTGDGIEEFGTMGCDCCDSPLAGEMHRFAILGEGDPEPEPGPEPEPEPDPGPVHPPEHRSSFAGDGCDVCDELFLAKHAKEA